MTDRTPHVQDKGSLSACGQPGHVLCGECIDIHRAKVGDAFTVPKGAPVHSTRDGEWTPAGRATTVYPYSVKDYGDIGTVVTWAGAGGYWRRVVIRDGEFVEDWGA